MTADTIMNRPPAFRAYCGQIRLPRMLVSVLPGPGKSVCFWCHRIIRWAVSSPTMMAGNRNSWTTNSRGMNDGPGKRPPHRL